MEEYRSADGLRETETYFYNGDKDKPKKITETVKQDTPEGKKTVSTTVTEFKYDEYGQITQRAVTIEDASGKRTVVTPYKDGLPITETDETNENAAVENSGDENNIKWDPYEVKPGEHWYSIVQNEYGISDHKQIMEAVHYLKAQNNRRKNQKGMPPEISLPSELPVLKSDPYQGHIYCRNTEN